MVRVFLGRNPNNGKRRYLDKTVRGTKKDTRRYLNGVLRDIDLGIFVEPSLLSVDDYLDKWLETMKAKVSPLTAKGYGYLLANHVRPALGARRLASISPRRIGEPHQARSRNPLRGLRPGRQMAIASAECGGTSRTAKTRSSGDVGSCSG
jgi:Phage integrase, N-terminal SAM-like domain